jgi:hypothetical protein
MIDDISSIGYDRSGLTVGGVAARPAVKNVDAGQAAQPLPEQSGLPAAPPREVLDALDRAQQAMADMASRQTSLRFDVDRETKTVTAQVIGPDGSILREIPARHGLDLLANNSVFDARG